MPGQIVEIQLEEDEYRDWTIAPAEAGRLMAPTDERRDAPGDYVLCRLGGKPGSLALSLKISDSYPPLPAAGDAELGDGSNLSSQQRRTQGRRRGYLARLPLLLRRDEPNSRQFACLQLLDPHAEARLDAG
jgi:hypothetical protein